MQPERAADHTRLSTAGPKTRAVISPHPSVHIYRYAHSVNVEFLS